MEAHALTIDAEIQVLVTEHVNLMESVGQHPILSASVLISKTPIEALKLIGAKCTWRVTHGNEQQVVFSGTIANVKYDGSFKETRSSQLCRASITAKGVSFKLDLAIATQSYSKADGSSAPLHELIGSAFSEIKAIKLLTSPCRHILRFRETEWSFLLRCAAMNGVGVVVKPNEVSLVGGTQPVIKLLVDDIVEGSSTLSSYVAIIDSQSTTWDFESGRIEDAKDSALPAGLSDLVKALCSRVSEIFPVARHKLFPNCLAVHQSDESRASRNAESQINQVAEWRFNTTRLDVSVGDSVECSDAGFKSIGRLNVVRRTLSVTESTTQVMASLQCENSVATQTGESAPRLFDPVGQVCAVNDREERARVKVNLPWHGRSSADASQWEGVWCLAPQPFGGMGENNQRHGVVQVPAVYDWVKVLMDVHDCELPVVVGAIYRGDQARTPQLVDVSKDRLLFLGNGLAVWARGIGPGGEPSLSICISNNEGKELAALTLKGDGTLRINANATIAGTLNVVEQEQ